MHVSDHVGMIERRGGKKHGLDSALKGGELQKKIRERKPKEHRSVRPLENATINRILALTASGNEYRSQGRFDLCCAIFSNAAGDQCAHRVRRGEAVPRATEASPGSRASTDGLFVYNGLPHWRCCQHHVGHG
jgi:hypothetical protein